MLCTSMAYAVVWCLSVHLRVCHVHVLCRNEYTFSNFFTIRWPHHFSLSTPNQYSIGKPLMGASNAECRGYEKNHNFQPISSFISEMIQVGWSLTALSAQKRLYFHLRSERLGNDTRQSHSYSGTPIGTHMWTIKWCHFQWPWMTLTQISRSCRY